MPRFRKPVRQARDIAPETAATALAELPERAGRLLRFIASTGCRPKEARLLQWSQVELSAGVCTLAEHKTAASTGELREIYLTPDAVTVLAAIPHRTGYVFLSRLGRPYSAGGLRAIWQRHIDATVYGLRHTFGQVGSEQMPEQDLAKLMGHTDTKTTRHYFSVKNARAREIAAAIVLPQLPPTPSPTEPAKHKSKAGAKKKTKAPSPRRAKKTGCGGATAARRRA